VSEADDDEEPLWRRPNGLFVFATVEGPAAGRIREIQDRFDPKLARSHPPHLTLVGSSGVGPILASTPLDVARAALTRIAHETPPLELHFGAPTRFMQTDIVSLPLDPHGPIRTLHDRIVRSGLAFAVARFTFTPHVTLSYYPTLTRDRARELLSLRVEEPARFTRMTVSASDDPLPSHPLFELPFGRSPDGALGGVQ
jgi:2'-5' RNA ligase